MKRDKFHGYSETKPCNFPQIVTPAEKNKDANIITYLRSAILRSLHISLLNEDFPINSDFFPNSVTSVEKGRTPPTINPVCVVVNVD